MMNYLNWKNYEYILKKYKLLVIMRNNDDIKDLLVNENIIITDIRRMNLSSTGLRNNLDKTKLDNKVYQYIQNNNLY